MENLIEKVSPRATNALLSQLHDLIKKKVSDQAQTVGDSQLPDRDLLLSTVRRKVERVLSLRFQPSSYRTQLKLVSRTQRESLLKAWPGSSSQPILIFLDRNAGTTRIQEKSVLNENTVLLPIDPSNWT